MVAAGRFADEARAGAELAAARSGAAKANAVNKDMKHSTATLDRRDAAQDRREPMNTTNYTWRRSLIGAAVAATLFAGCASAPTPPAGSAAGARQAHRAAG